MRLYQAQRPGLGKREAAKEVALWVAAEARTELLLRELGADWLRRLERRAAASPVAVPVAPAAPALL